MAATRSSYGLEREFGFGAHRVVLPRVEESPGEPSSYLLRAMPGAGAERGGRNASLTTRSLRYPGEATKGTWRDRIRDFFSVGLRKRHRSEEARRRPRVGRNVAVARSKSWGPDAALRVERDARAGRTVSAALEGTRLEKGRQRSSVGGAGGAQERQPRPLFQQHRQHGILVLHT